ncbi:hypothetical protein [Rhizomonospora bruguierae]|uniref:hypothetical protein n=1 Tax=Rhizomonospora bruguierae TaxID=1581705 RepID=UPI001BD01F64|nr:hypothetical protein [Micromonospora sp. NBRC 107566]
MSKHPPHHHPTNPNPNSDPNPNPDPNGTAGAPSTRDVQEQLLVDVVAGDPPVPITVWRTARTSGDHGASIPARLARRLVAAYSRPGEAVVDLTADHALTFASCTGGRRHHRAWFTDVASLIIGPATSSLGDEDTTEPDDELDTDLTTAGADGVELDVSLADWFGDDLTDPHLPPTAPPVVPIPDGVSLAGLTSLVVATWPLDPDAVPNRIRLAWLLTACRELLRPGGCLVLVVAVPAGLAATPEDFSPIAAAAAQVGLGYLQHIVAVAADTSGDGHGDGHGDAFVYHLDDEELLALSKARADNAGEQWTVAHLRVHADLLVFTPVVAGRRRGGSRRAGRSGEATNG